MQRLKVWQIVITTVLQNYTVLQPNRTEKIKTVLQFTYLIVSWSSTQKKSLLCLYPTLTLGTVNDIGSTVVCVNLQACAISTFFTSHVDLSISASAWCKPSGCVDSRGNRWGYSSDTSNAKMLASPYVQIHQFYRLFVTTRINIKAVKILSANKLKKYLSTSQHINIYKLNK